MKSHPAPRRDAIEQAEGACWARRWPSVDGQGHRLLPPGEVGRRSGYAQGLRGETIPLSARLMALAGVYDALISRRSTRTACRRAGGGDHRRGRAVRQFDPVIVEAFLRIQPEFESIARRFADDDAALARKRAWMETVSPPDLTPLGVERGR